jgi:hypothetical protein
MGRPGFSHNASVLCSLRVWTDSGGPEEWTMKKRRRLSVGTLAWVAC